MFFTTDLSSVCLRFSSPAKRSVAGVSFGSGALGGREDFCAGRAVQMRKCADMQMRRLREESRFGMDSEKMRCEIRENVGCMDTDRLPAKKEL
jgi:hypothetical protein